MYFISTSDNKITSKNEISDLLELPEGYREITKELYDSIGVIPCSFTEVNGEITSIEYIEPISTSEPLDQKSDLEILQEKYTALQGAMDFVVMNF